MLQRIWATSCVYVDHVGTCLCMCAYACVLFRKVLRSQHHRNLHADWSLVRLLCGVTLLLTGSSLTTTPKIFSVPLWLFWHATLPGTWLIHVAITKFPDNGNASHATYKEIGLKMYQAYPCIAQTGKHPYVWASVIVCIWHFRLKKLYMQLPNCVMSAIIAIA